MQAALGTFKDKLSTAPVLANPDLQSPFVVETDAFGSPLVLYFPKLRMTDM